MGNMSAQKLEIHLMLSIRLIKVLLVRLWMDHLRMLIMLSSLPEMLLRVNGERWMLMNGRKLCINLQTCWILMLNGLDTFKH
ncbi:UNVERIFIED_CONTAM: hypothetical protein GTU68_063401 [Idotea baltica]|nr:hypothetical protein [Idotea baltica]